MGALQTEDLEGDLYGGVGLDTSVEFCGGTHLKYAGHIGDFIITSEEAIAKGIRRIIALTGPEATKALKHIEGFENRLNTLKMAISDDKDGIDSKENVKRIVELTEDSALKQIRSLNPSTSAMFVSVDQSAKKIFCLSYVSKEGVEKGLKANEWVSSTSSLINGKGGGKADSA